MSSIHLSFRTQSSYNTVAYVSLTIVSVLLILLQQGNARHYMASSSDKSSKHVINNTKGALLFIERRSEESENCI